MRTYAVAGLPRVYRENDALHQHDLHEALMGAAIRLGCPHVPNGLPELNEESPAGLLLASRQGEVVRRLPIYQPRPELTPMQIGAAVAWGAIDAAFDEVSDLRQALGEIAVAFDCDVDGTAPRDARKNVDVRTTNFDGVFEIRRSCDACRAIFRSFHPYPRDWTIFDVADRARFPARDICRECRAHGPGYGKGSRNTYTISTDAPRNPTEILREYLESAGISLTVEAVDELSEAVEEAGCAIRQFADQLARFEQMDREGDGDFATLRPPEPWHYWPEDGIHRPDPPPEGYGPTFEIVDEEDDDG